MWPFNKKEVEKELTEEELRNRARSRYYYFFNGDGWHAKIWSPDYHNPKLFEKEWVSIKTHDGGYIKEKPGTLTCVKDRFTDEERKLWGEIENP